MNINKIEFFIDAIVSEKPYENGVEFVIDFNLYHGQNLKFMKYIKKKINEGNPLFKRHLNKSKNVVSFGVRLGNGNVLEALKWNELFSNCMNKTHLIMIANSTKDWLFKMFLDIFFEIDIDNYIEIEYGENMLDILVKQQKIYEEF